MTEVSRGTGPQECECEWYKLWLSVPTRENEKFSIFISSLLCRGKARR